jgi:hypothetical protein
MKIQTFILSTLLAGVLCFEACVIPAWVNTAESDAQVAIPIAASLVDVIDPALAPVVTLIENGFIALSKALDTYKADLQANSPNTATDLRAVQAAFEAVNTNVAQLESAAQIKDPASQSTVTAVVALLTQAVTEIAALMPATAAGARVAEVESVKAQVRGQPKGWKAKDFKKAFNAIAKNDLRLKGHMFKLSWRERL